MFLQQLSTETLVFIGLILIMAIFFHVKYDKKIAESAPTILTTLGIFATFFAIALGLLKFNSSNIQQSVPALLDSMKTAFWASVFGVGCALTFKIREAFTSDEEYYDEDFNRAVLDKLELLRKDNNEHLENLTNSLSEALNKIAKSSSDELVKALQEVIKDFNTKINEQFGENFKQLNQAVEKLVIWQEQYKGYIDSSTNTLNQIITNIQGLNTKFDGLVNNSTQLTNNINTVTQNAQSFNNTAQQLQSVLGNLDKQREAIQTQLTTLSSLVSQASNDLPKIHTQILEIGTTMQNSANGFNTQVSELANNTKNQTDALTAGIEEALKQSLNTLGGQLASMTEKFASDYNQLSNALARISQTTRNSGL